MTRPENCICDYNPDTTDGPEIDCPVHGDPAVLEGPGFALIEIPHGPDWREKLTPGQRAALGISLEPPPSMTPAQRRKLAQVRADERFRELRANGVDYLRARDLAGVGRRWGDSLAGWVGISETDYLQGRREMQETIRDMGARCGMVPAYGSLEAVQLMASGIADHATGAARMRLRAGMLG